MTDDVQDIAATLDGDLEAFGRIVDRRQQDLRGFVAILGVGRDDVDDIAQQTFVAAYTSLAKFRTDGDFGVWLRGIARNMARSHFRRQKGRQAILAVRNFLLDAADEPKPAPTLRVPKLKDCIGKLSEKYQKFVEMRYYEKCTAEQIGEQFGCAASTVRVLQGRIRLQLRKCMESSEGQA